MLISSDDTPPGTNDHAKQINHLTPKCYIHVYMYVLNKYCNPAKTELTRWTTS